MSRSSFDPFSNLHIKYISIVVVVVVVMSFTPRPVSFAKTDRPSSMLSSAKAQLGRVFSRLTSGSTPPSQREEKDDDDDAFGGATRSNLALTARGQKKTPAATKTSSPPDFAVASRRDQGRRRDANDDDEGGGGGGGETVSKTTIAAKTVENGEDSDDGAKLCLDERGRVHAKGNAKLEYASKSSILFNFSSSEQIQKEYFRLLRDCKKVFTAKQTLETESYSAGSTFWISAAATTTAKEEKREENKKRKINNERKKVSLLRSSSKLSGLERLALRVFEHVTQHLKEGEEYDSNTSGAEWWTQVIDPRDDIGAHFDKDYYLEENMNISVHPQVGTVTYLSDEGAPTVVATSVVLSLIHI